MATANVNSQAPTAIYRGEDAVIHFDPVSSGQPDMTTWTVAYTLKSNAVIALELLSSDPSPQVVISGGASSTVDVTLTRAQTSALSPCVYDWDLWRVATAGSYIRIAGGRQQFLDPIYPPVGA